MFGGLCVVAILLWIASLLQTPQASPNSSSSSHSTPAAAGDLYVGGHVNHPGMYAIHIDETLKDAVASAGGGDSLPADLVVRLTRKVRDNPSTLSIPMPQVLSGESNQKVQPGDVIDVVQQAKPTTLQITPAPPAAPQGSVTIP